jgi:hypothetical protein
LDLRASRPPRAVAIAVIPARRMAVFIGGKVAEMKMIFIFGGRVVLSVSQSKI